MAETGDGGKAARTVLLIIITGILIAEILINLTPPISRDALIHHLAIPKLWLSHGGFYEMPWAVFSYYPMNINVLYLIPLYFGNDILPKFMHWAFGLGIALMIYTYLEKRLGKNWGLLGILIFISTPLVVRLSTSAYIDLGMVFFTTASIMAWVRWREGEYNENQWLVISAVCMGLAVGSKYNAMIAWFFMNLMLVFSLSRDTGKSGLAVKSGAIFFAITLIIASPWFVKNLILTGNPMFPLFDGFFKALHGIAHGTSNGGGSDAAGWASNIFHRRAVMFGETFWEVLLIPVRIFFQGRDDSAQYFDGVLNPILLITVPFAFFRKDFRRDKMFFLLFSAFFFFMAYFMRGIRVRYILPIIPPLVIMSVMGIKYLYDYAGEKIFPVRRIVTVAVVALAVVLLSYNVYYLKHYFLTIDPVKYILHRETKDEFLTRQVGSYPAMRFINENLPENAKIFLMFLGGRGYYLDRPYRMDPSYGMSTLNRMVNATQDIKKFQNYLRSLQSTHFLVRNDMFMKYLNDNFSAEDQEQFFKLLRQCWKPVFVTPQYSVYELLCGT
ncbi:MAG TPA: phospholipid carrier-dependent glycosyltransferase [Deltaproteobacteria bacterium]|nr:phospholipid carrier-dependent glycosyltransferase [Deltaproteobacteria bacterium]